MSKEMILKNIRHALQYREKFNFQTHFVDGIKHEEESLLEEFIQFQSKNKAELIHSNPENLKQDLEEVIKNAGIKKLLCATDLSLDITQIEGVQTLPYDKSIEENREELFGIEASIIEARVGIANLGIVGIVSSTASPRLTSLIAPHCIMLLDSKKILANLYEGLEYLKKMQDILPTNILFIAGPSRTADIELQTVFGVHGPQKTTVILY
ncbi:putative L-lactate dehydrogenase subunit YkgG [Helicobacter mustelae]|uniref:LutC/YkgG family protein n=1 Tax=Helicobacter mustelae TaxID=217 RepID=UPI000E005ADD|nr:lactate utilization protein C [Helicobacter mustelae]STP12699.1 putative L-lactate dehydrogenase subunit YkgG [Helicobacter mustelae]